MTEASKGNGNGSTQPQPSKRPVDNRPPNRPAGPQHPTPPTKRHVAPLEWAMSAKPASQALVNQLWSLLPFDPGLLSGDSALGRAS